MGRTKRGSQETSLGYEHPQSSNSIIMKSPEFVDLDTTPSLSHIPIKRLTRALPTDSNSCDPRSTVGDPLIAIALTTGIPDHIMGLSDIQSSPRRRPHFPQTERNSGNRNLSTPAKRPLTEVINSETSLGSLKRVRVNVAANASCDESIGSCGNITVGAEQMLRMIDDSLVDTPERYSSRIVTPSVHLAAPGPSPRGQGLIYAYESE